MRQTESKRMARRAGFTLVELLVVIGIIALLISILLPSLNKAREAARRVKCLSNMRQIVMAMNMFAQDNQGFMPGRGGKTRYISTKTGQSAWGTASVNDEVADWINWYRAIDPVTGASVSGVTLGSNGDGNITLSALGKYLGVKPKVHQTLAEANTISPQLESVYRCPSDKLEQRPQAFVSPTAGVYRYSYSTNFNYMSPAKSAIPGYGGVIPSQLPANLATNALQALNAGQRSDGIFNGKLSSIKGTSDKILLICEDENTITAASFKPQPYLWASAPPQGPNLLASRHDGSMTKTATNAITSSGTGLPVNSRGNVVMADGHGEFLTRKEALSQVHTGNPYPDPAAGSIAGW